MRAAMRRRRARNINTHGTLAHLIRSGYSVSRKKNTTRHRENIGFQRGDDKTC